MRSLLKMLIQFGYHGIRHKISSHYLAWDKYSRAKYKQEQREIRLLRNMPEW